jgi:predicted RNA binding protein YcfA (HicA-like mRNA interferase family)
VCGAGAKRRATPPGVAPAAGGGQKNTCNTYKYTYNIVVNVKEVIKILYADGWKKCEQKGSHIQLEHNVKKGKVTVANHKGDLPKKTLHSIMKQAGLI